MIKTDIVHGCLSILIGCAALGLGAGYVQAQAVEKAIVVSPDDESIAWGGCPEFMPEGCQIGVLHGDPASPNADIFFKVPGGAEIPSHKHTSAERMVLVSGELEVTYDGQEPVVIRKGDYAYGPAELPHDAHCRSGEPCILYIGFIDPVDAILVEATE
jgi:quercetin dioxygenase-like cupin family protein